MVVVYDRLIKEHPHGRAWRTIAEDSENKKRAARRTERSLNKVVNACDAVAESYTETFSNDYEKKAKDRELLLRFSQEIEGKNRSGIFAVVPAKLSNT